MLLSSHYLDESTVIGFDIVFGGENDSRGDIALVDITRDNQDKIVHAIEFLNKKKPGTIAGSLALNVKGSLNEKDFLEGIEGVQKPFADLLSVTNHIGHINRGYDKILVEDRYYPIVIYYESYQREN